jgi:hypothetical protein
VGRRRHREAYQRRDRGECALLYPASITITPASPRLEDVAELHEPAFALAGVPLNSEPSADVAVHAKS